MPGENIKIFSARRFLTLWFYFIAAITFMNKQLQITYSKFDDLAKSHFIYHVYAFKPEN